ncbi:MAG: leucine-rich repeat domain-containing protein [Clostridia bacterium]|nr:leucine-rich repeat domain-containing protein [Clostridia bacterium]
MRKLMICLLVLALCLPCALAETEMTRHISGNWVYVLQEDGTAELVDYLDDMARIDLVIPAEVDGYAVTAIGDRAMQENVFQSVVIPEGVTRIGVGAFYWSYEMTAVTLPSTLREIGDYAFKWCAEVEVFAIPEGVRAIGREAFQGNYSMVSLTLPDSLEHIGMLAFHGCSNLTTLVLPANVKTIGERAFDSCIGLMAVTLPDSLEYIGVDAFANCTALTEITLPQSLVEMADYPFRGCTMLDMEALLAAWPAYQIIGGVVYDMQEMALCWWSARGARLRSWRRSTGSASLIRRSEAACGTFHSAKFAYNAATVKKSSADHSCYDISREHCIQRALPELHRLTTDLPSTGGATHEGNQPCHSRRLS